MRGENYELSVFCAEFEQFFVQFAEQLGHGEIFIEADEILPVDSPVTVVFNLVYEDLPFLRVNGTIISAGGETSGGIDKRMTVKIDQTDESIRGFLVDLVKHQLKNELSRLFTT